MCAWSEWRHLPSELPAPSATRGPTGSARGRTRVAIVALHVPADQRRAEPARHTVRHLRAHRAQRGGLRPGQPPAHDAGGGPREPRARGLRRGASADVAERCRARLACRAALGLRPVRVRLRLPPCQPVLDRAVHLDVPPRRVVAPAGEHALPVDLRRQCRASSRRGAVRRRLPADRSRGYAVPRGLRFVVTAPARRSVGRHLRRARLLLRVVPAQPRARLDLHHLHRAHLPLARARRARVLPRHQQHPAVPGAGWRLGRRCLRRAHRGLPRGRRDRIRPGPAGDHVATARVPESRRPSGGRRTAP